MQRNFTPQGKPQDPGALDRQAHAEAWGELSVLTPRLVALAARLATLKLTATDADLVTNTTAQLRAVVRDVRLALGVR